MYDISDAASWWQPRIRYSKPAQTPATLVVLVVLWGGKPAIANNHAKYLTGYSCQLAPSNTRIFPMRIRAIAHAEEVLIAELWRRSWASVNPNVTFLEPHEHWLSRVRSEFSNPSELLVVKTKGEIGAFVVFDVVNG